jgi:hypothetical protein
MRESINGRIFIPLHYLSHKFNVYCLKAIKIISFTFKEESMRLNFVEL